MTEQRKLDIYCHGCGVVKVAILDGSLKLRPGAKILCPDCLPYWLQPKEGSEVVDSLAKMFGMK